MGAIFGRLWRRRGHRETAELDEILMRNQLNELEMSERSSASNASGPSPSTRSGFFNSSPSINHRHAKEQNQGYQGSFASLAFFLKKCLDAGLPGQQYDKLLKALIEVNKTSGKVAKVNVNARHFAGTDPELATYLLSSLGVRTNIELQSGKETNTARAHVTQSDMIQLFQEQVMQEGQLMHKTKPVMIRPAKCGECVVTKVGGRVTSEMEVSDDSSWVVKASTVHQEEYVLNQANFDLNWEVRSKEELDRSDPQLNSLAELGFKKYWPKPGILKWMYKLKKTDVEQLPSRNFQTTWGAIQLIKLGDHLVMQYPDAKSAEIYLMPNDVVEGGYVKHQDAPEEAGQRRTSLSKEQAAVLLTLSFDFRTRGDDIKADTDLVMHGLANPFDLLFRYQIQADTMYAWITTIAEQYLKNPYHDWRHAFDVFQFIRYGLTVGEASKYFHFQDVLVLLVAALAHDVAHPGFTNVFLINTQADLAVDYNDKSPLENMHASVFFQTLKRPGCDFLANASSSNFKNFRGKVIDAILSTDMSHHFEMVDKFTVRVNQAKQDSPFVVGSDLLGIEDADCRLLIQAFVHMSDIGHCARPWSYHQNNVLALETEFFLQGDRERELGLTVMPMMDRHRDSAAVGQGFFCTKLVKPLLEPYMYFMNRFKRTAMMKNLEENSKQWTALVEKYGKKTAKEILELENALTNQSA